jgi:hypothetical protein
LALRIGEGADEAEWKTAAKLGVTAKEIDKLCRAVVDALGSDPKSPDELKDAVAGAARSLGPEGTKKGISNTLPLALGRLQLTGDIRRVPVGGRLDQQRYRYVRWMPSPLASYKLSKTEALSEAGRRYFQWIGPATLAEFQWFSGLGVKAAKEALAPLGLVPLAEGDPRMLFPEDLQALRSFRPPKEPQYALVSPLDGVSLLRRDLKGLLDPGDLERSVPIEKGEKALGTLADLPSHAILDRGKVVGLWEYDSEAESIAWMTFGKKNKPMEAAVKEIQEYVRTQLGDARSFSLDSPKSRAPRVAALRAAG